MPKKAIFIEKNCRFCDTLFSVSANAVRASKKIFCSKSCFRKSVKLSLIEKKCKQCQVIFFVEKTDKDRKFCNPDCYYNWRIGRLFVTLA